VAGDLVKRMSERKVFDEKLVRVIYTSELFPGTGYGISHRLKPEVAEKVKQAFLTYDWNDPGLRNEFPGVDRFAAIDYKERWKIFRDVDAETGVKYDCK
jgi:phosphonate transport system substrate-binding protein